MKGLQHCVIGYGQSVYATFQSCPRYVDQLLEKLGSRRMLQRVELDEGPDETIAAGMESDDFTTMGTGAGEVEQDVIYQMRPHRVGMGPVRYRHPPAVHSQEGGWALERRLEPSLWP